LPFKWRALQPRLANRLLYVIILTFILVMAGAVLGSIFQGGKNLIINEVMTSNRCTISDEDGDYPDWFEIYNPGDKEVLLDGYWVTDDPADPYRWAFPAASIGPGDYLTIFASGKDRIDPGNPYLHTNFQLSASGNDLLLIDPEASVIDSISVPALFSNVSFGRKPGNVETWLYFLDATPGAENSSSSYEQVAEIPAAEEQPVLINEFLVVNRTSIPDEDGDLSDWIELHNTDDSPVNLAGWWLSDKDDNPFKWRFPEKVLEPDQYLVVFASGKNRTAPDSAFLHTNFSLNDRDDTLILSMPNGAVVDKMEIRNMERDVSYGRDQKDPEKWLYYPRPTPGEPNYTRGFDVFSGSPVPDLVISEAMAANLTTIADEDGDYNDFIEIFNRAEYPVNLGEYGLSDSEEQPYRWQFPSVTIEPEEYLLIFASGKDRRDPEGLFLHTNFKIRSNGETLVLSHPSGMTIDQMPTGKQHGDLSAGLLPGDFTKRYFMENPSPGEENRSPFFDGYTMAPQISPIGGFYNQPFEVIIIPPSLETEVRYTLDGSEPTPESTLYTAPLHIEDTSILRVRAFSEDAMPSPVTSCSYFLNTDHELTVVSIMMDPDDLFDPADGIYVRGYNASSEFPYRGANFWKDIEKPIHIEMYEPDGTLGWDMEAGIKIGGQYSRAMDQKIFNVFFRNIYGHNEMRYPLFGDKDLTRFKAITLRTSGQDAVFSKIRDIMTTSLLEETGLDYQAHRQAVLYLNGEYWGIYNIRERANRYMVAHNHELDPDKIDLLQGNWRVRAGSNEEYLALLDFVRNNDLSRNENYAYIQNKMDVTNYIDALIAQVYFAQTDQGNIRYWREQSEEGKWRWLIYDLDWAFWPSHLYNNTLASMTSPAGTGVRQSVDTTLTVNLLRNNDFTTELIERFAYHINNTFASERTVDRITILADNIESEMPRQIDRWGGSMEHWRREIEQLKEFARLRPLIVMEHVQKKFQLSDEKMAIFEQWPDR